MPGKVKDKKVKTGTGHARAGKYSPRAWGMSGLHEIVIPSGDMILARRIGPTEMVKSGMLSKVDVLSAIVQTDHIDRVEGRTEEKAQSAAEKERAQAAEIAEMMKDPAKLLAAMEVIDDITLLVVVEPTVHAVPVPRAATAQDILDFEHLTEVGEEFLPPRVEGLIYVDSIPWDDKMFLFQWTIGGTTDLEAFREGLGAGMDAVSALEGDPGAAERTDGDD